ncbi:hypothetical protein [Psychrobacter sp. AOP7-B1-24]|uniref:hypothetical protein n=1 Tax=Psychrobacter sp. AOP7-B1-24 TaxID=3457645 RepID=UPI00402BDC40
MTTTNPQLDSAPISNQSHHLSNNQSPQPHHPQPSRLKLTYDILMIIIISIDLLLISVDAILMSNFSTHAAEWLTIGESLSWYQNTVHVPLRTAGGFFTIFLIAELFVRWMIAITQQTYYRWFFFPFVHWYEVLGCFPQLRALRLFRAVVIGHRLYQLGYQVLPQSWIDRIKFYIDLLLEELSDRVILTTIQNFRQELTNSDTHKSFIESTVARNRDEIEAALLSVLRTELVPKLQALTTDSGGGNILANEVGNAIEEGLANTPELRRYLRMIPIAGGLIESQLQHVGHNIGENVVYALNERLLDPKILDSLMVEIARGVAQINTDNTALDTLISSIIDDSLTELEAQVKVQQWKHQDMLNL